jgi:hypothetical protein
VTSTPMPSPGRTAISNVFIRRAQVLRISSFVEFDNIVDELVEILFAVVSISAVIEVVDSVLNLSAQLLACAFDIVDESLSFIRPVDSVLALIQLLYARVDAISHFVAIHLEALQRAMNIVMRQRAAVKKFFCTIGLRRTGRLRILRLTSPCASAIIAPLSRTARAVFTKMTSGRVAKSECKRA